MKEGFRTNLRQMRTRLGLSQQELADLAGITRQTISGAETGQYVPSTAIALRLGRILGCSVEELFWLEGAAPVVEAIPAAGFPAMFSGAERSVRVSVAQVGGRWIAHPLQGAPAFRVELVPADGVVHVPGAALLSVRLLDEPDHLAQTALIAGCDPALSLWARAAERWQPDLRIGWLWANSTEALLALRRGEVHAAGTHLFDPATGESNLPFVRRLLPDVPVVLVNLATWSEGLLLSQGNPKGIRSVEDLRHPAVRIVNREPGAGARHLLDAALQAAGIDPAEIQGYDRVQSDHRRSPRPSPVGRPTLASARPQSPPPGDWTSCHSRPSATTWPSLRPT
jgi:putative molybdopterin biosynthesis protein